MARRLTIYTRAITFKVTAEQEKAIRRAAKSRGMNVATFVRDVLWSSLPVTHTNGMRLETPPRLP